MSYEEDMAAARTAMRKLMQTECEELNILIPMLDRIIALREARNRPVVLFRAPGMRRPGCGPSC